MNLTAARQAVAAALNTVPGLHIGTRALKTPLAGDGWVVFNRMEPSDFSSCLVTLTAVVILGTDVDTADGLLEELAVPVIDAITKSPDLNPADVVLENQLLIGGDNSLYALALSLTLEVD